MHGGRGCLEDEGVPDSRRARREAGGGGREAGGAGGHDTRCPARITGRSLPARQKGQYTSEVVMITPTELLSKMRLIGGLVD